MAALRRFNEWIALHLGDFFSTMACFWLFNLVALFPFIWPASLQIAQYVSSGYLQLVALPLLAVVTRLTGRAAESRAQQDHLAIMGEVETLKTIQSEQHVILNLLQKQAHN